MGLTRKDLSGKICPMERTVWVLDDAKATKLADSGCSVSEIARQCGVSRQTVYTAIRKGRVPKPARKERAA